MTDLKLAVARHCDAVLACDGVSQTVKEWAKSLRAKCVGGYDFANIFG